MSYNSKLEAETAANDCLKLMKTKGWKICVHENLGWHWCLEHVGGHICLYQSSFAAAGSGYYTLMSDGETAHSGCLNWHSENHFNDPNKAVEHQLQIAREFAQKTTKWVDEVEKKIRG